MASNIKALPEKNMRGAPENRDMPLPLLDLSDAAVKELIRSAKKRGYVTVDQINSVLPSKAANPVQIKEILSIFREMGVEEAETREAEPEEGVATREEPEEEDEVRTSLSKSSNGRFRPSPGPRNPPSARTTPCACISAKWARWNSFRARARSLLPSASRPAARP